MVSDHPELIDINWGESVADWVHANGLGYNEEFDQIVISVRGYDEIWVIDHSTTTAEAAGNTGGNSGKGGDILYRWGNPEAYGQGVQADQKLFAQHDAQWVPAGLPGAGNIIIFNNGTGRPGGDASSADEIVPPVDGSGNYAKTVGVPFDPPSTTWEYLDPVPTDWLAPIISGVHRMPNGNTLITSGPTGRFFEVTDAKQTVWEYVNPRIATGPIIQGDPVPNGFGPTLLNFTF